ncbi:MAG: glycerol-3-phosphate 1-O-acyltransferase PlsY [Desulfovibrionales bacterium]
MVNIFWLALSYLLGSVPFGLLVAKNLCGKDPRDSGSGNIGATNVARLCGAKYGGLTLLLDLLKGFLPVALAAGFSDSTLFLSLTGLAALCGHMYSVFLSGKGGKGVATTIGVFLALAPWALFWSLLLCGVAIQASGYVSLGSLTLVTVLPIFLLFTGNFGFIPVGLIILVLVYAKHRDNILRLARGEEKSWRTPPSPQDPAADSQ